MPLFLELLFNLVILLFDLKLSDLFGSLLSGYQFIQLLLLFFAHLTHFLNLLDFLLGVINVVLMLSRPLFSWRNWHVFVSFVLVLC